MGLLETRPRAGWKTWMSAIIGSVLLLGRVLLQLDSTSLRSVAVGLSWPLVGVSVLFFFTEGVVTAKRLSIMAGTHQSLARALQANAWYSVLVVALPARLGEFAAILVMEKYLLQKRAPAFASIVVQRLFDLVMLGVLFLLVLAFLIEQLPLAVSAAVAMLVIGIALSAIQQMEPLLTLMARWVLSTRIRFSRSLRRKIARQLLQGRGWRRQMASTGLIPSAMSLTAVKWLVIVGGISALLIASQDSLTWQSALIAAVAYCFMSAVPIQSLGGIGLGEAGLTFLLAGMGMPVGVAAATSLIVRLVLILFPAIFFLTVFFLVSLENIVQSGKSAGG